jgi:enhancer of mRNA-decapping protein 4
MLKKHFSTLKINGTFNKGLHEYLHEFDQTVKQTRQLYNENKDPVINQMRQLSEHMQANSKLIAEEMATTLQQQFDNHLRSSNAVLQDILISSVKAIIKEEIQVAMRDQQHILPDRLINQMRQSGTMTPVNLPGGNAGGYLNGQQNQQQQVSTVQEQKAQITHFLKLNQYNSAFQAALCASDLGLLMSLCELVNPGQVFEVNTNNPSKKPQCQLQQPVILSLIQQLSSSDLASHTELKVKYIEEALVNLDISSQVTREHMPGVISQLIVKIQQYITAHPNDKSAKSMRMLLMASQSLLSQPRPKMSTSGSGVGLAGQSLANSASHHDTF